MKSGSIGSPYTPRGPICAHQIHAHGVAAEREKGRVPQAQDAAVAPDQVHRQRQHAVAQVLADQSEPVGREVKRGRRGHNLIEERHEQRPAASTPRNHPAAAIARAR